MRTFTKIAVAGTTAYFLATKASSILKYNAFTWQKNKLQKEMQENPGSTGAFVTAILAMSSAGKILKETEV